MEGSDQHYYYYYYYYYYISSFRCSTRPLPLRIMQHSQQQTKYEFLTLWNRIPLPEAKIFSASQEFPRNLGNPQVHYPFHYSSPILPTVSKVNTILTFNLVSCLLNSHLNVGLPSGYSLFFELCFHLRATCVFQPDLVRFNDITTTTGRVQSATL